MKKKRKAEMIHKKIKEFFFLEGTQNERERRSPRSLFYTEAVHFTKYIHIYVYEFRIYFLKKRERIIKYKKKNNIFGDLIFYLPHKY